MKNNLYTQAINNIKAPKRLIDNTVGNIHGTTTESEVITMDKRKYRTLKFTSAIAAVLTLIITLGTISLTGYNNIEHPFILTVGAAEATSDEATIDEITPEAYVKVGEIKGFADSERILHRAQFNESGDKFYDLYKGELLSLMEEFTIEMTCTGENIESVTYTAHNSCLAYDEDFAGLLGAVELTDEEIQRYNATGGTNFYKWASSCTYDYNNQPKSLWNAAVMGFEIPEDGLDGTIPLKLAFTFDFESGDYMVAINEDDGSIDINHIFEKEFNAHADEFALDVTANFTDSTSSTKTLKFRCENEGKHLYMYAIEA